MAEKNNNKEHLRKRNVNFVSIITSVAFIVLSVYFLSQTVRSVGITRQKLDIFDKAKDEVTDLRVKNIKLILMAERVETEEYIEEEARNRLNYAKDGEILFIIPEELLVDEDLDSYINTFSYGYKDPNMEELPNLDVWKQFFITGI